MGVRLLRVRVENVVATVDVGCRLDLRDLALRIPGATYDSSRFPGLVLRINKLRATALVFSTGRIVCAGARSVREAELAVKRVIDALRVAGVDVGRMRTRIQNVVLSAHLGGVIDLDGVTNTLGRVMYEPDQFPAAVYRMSEPKVTMLIFSSGKVVCAGARNEEEGIAAIEKLRRQLEEEGLIKYE